jgi:uncharacterized protein YaeQ
MAGNATIFKAVLHLADMDRNYYATHALTMARHPSETDERLMVRLLAFALHADDALEFGRGLSTQDEPDLWRKDLTGAIDLWVDVGLPDERAVRRACHRARHVTVVGYGGRAVGLWWSQNRERLERHDNLTIINLPYEGTQKLAGLAQRTMELQCNIQEGEVSLIHGSDLVQVQPERWLTGKQRD